MRNVILTSVLLIPTSSLIAQSLPKILILRAEDPIANPSEASIDGRLARELGRQAFLVAAREEFGILTSDEMLGETIDDAALARVALDLTAEVRTYWHGTTRFTLHGEDIPQSLQKPIEPSLVKLSIPKLYTQLAIAWEAVSRGEMVERLINAGFTPKASAINADNKPSERIENYLNEVDWLYQYAAVKAAHRAISKEGVSIEWLSVLARGYAHLGTLTEHHWTSTPEIFFARSLLYAERARQFDPSNSEALLLRPYALTFASAHANALAEFEEINISSDSLPNWAKLIDPACRFDLERLQELGNEKDELKPMSRWLILCLRRTFGGHRLLHDYAMDALTESPAGYGAYSNLVTFYPSLLSQRIGAHRGPAAFGKLFPNRFEKLFEQFVSNENGFSNNINLDLHNFTRPEEDFQKPAQIASNLRSAEFSEVSPTEPSLGVLASMIEEEIFVMAANYCKAMTNQVEVSLAEDVDAILPFVKEHPYSAYIRLYRYPRSQHPAIREKLFDNLCIKHPRHNMKAMFIELDELPSNPDTEGMNIARRTSRHAYWSSDYRLSSMAEEKIGGSNWWWDSLSAAQRQRLFNNYKLVSPYSLHWLRGEISLAKNPTTDQLAEWEPLAEKDCTACEWIGNHYYKAGEKERSLQWYHHAYELVPNRGTAWKIANIHRLSGDRNKWQKILDDCLANVEPRGLEHIDLRIDIARVLMSEYKDFEAAIKYAERAALAHSASGLSIAMAANEGAGNLKRADDFARQASTSYVSKWGDQWYLFRKRNHYGDPAEARPFIEKTLEAERGRPWLTLFLPVLDGDLKVAFERFHARGAKTREIYWYMMSSLLAAEMKESEKLESELKTIRNLNNQYLKDVNPPFFNMVKTCVGLLESPDSTKIDSLQLESQLAGMPDRYRRDYEFFLGAILQVIDREPELSEMLLRVSANTPDFTDINGNLAGFYLGRRHKNVRPQPAKEDGTNVRETIH